MWSSEGGGRTTFANLSILTVTLSVATVFPADLSSRAACRYTLPVIATTGADASETEWLTLFAVRHIPNGLGGYDTEINVQERLKYRHVGVTEQHGLHQRILLIFSSISSDFR